MPMVYYGNTLTYLITDDTRFKMNCIVVVIAGQIIQMPGLGRVPAAVNMKLSDDGDFLCVAEARPSSH